jgi:D-sedoheptulose 7-phosphate isomerase
VAHAERDPSFHDVIAAGLAQHRAALAATLLDLESQTSLLAEITALLLVTLRSGGKVMVAGNGGSAAESQHFAAELVGRFRRERSPYAALALTTDSSILTAIANDYGYEEVFVRQVVGLGRPGDVLVAFSTSGESTNLLLAAGAARDRDIVVVAFTGARENSLAEAANLALRVPATETPIVQEVHTMMTHLLCDLIEAELANDEAGRQE